MTEQLIGRNYVNIGVDSKVSLESSLTVNCLCQSRSTYTAYKLSVRDAIKVGGVGVQT